MFKTYIIIATYNAENWLEICLPSIDISLYSIIIVDNASSDDTVSIIRMRYPFVHLICNEINKGFGHANNQGIQYALEHDADYIFLLNQDAWLESDTIEKLILEHKNNAEYWILSPAQMHSIHKCPEPQFHVFLRKNRIDVNNKYTQEIDFVGASLWLMTRQCIEIVGGFDPLFPHYGEDNDYINRVHYWGGKIGVCPHIIAYHDRPLTTPCQKSCNISKKRVGLAYLGVLKDINHSIVYNFARVLVMFLKGLFRCIIYLRFRLITTYISAIYSACTHKGVLHARLLSKQKKAYL